MATLTQSQLAQAVAFFYAHAGFSYDPLKETKRQGRMRCAKQLAHAERWARSCLISFRWEIDESGDSSDFSDEQPAWSLWSCCALKDDGKTVLASLGGIDFGRDGEPWGDNYKRVVEAELAIESHV